MKYEDWEEVKLQEICDFKYGKMAQEKIKSETGYPIFSGYRITGYAKEYLYDEPMLLVVARGVGGTGDVKISPPKSWITNLSIILDIDKLKVNQKFLRDLLGLSSLKHILDSGSAQSQITIDSLKPFKIKLPPLKTQKKIAKILSNYDDLIENNLKQIKLLEEKARLTYEEWFLRFRVDGVRLEIDSDSGLPFGWEKKRITALVNLNKNSISKKNAPKKIKYIDIASTQTGYYNSTEMNFEDAPSRARRVLKYGDIIFSTVRPNRKTYSLILENDSSLIASTGFVVMTPILNENYPFVYLTISSQEFIDNVVSIAGGVAYPAINQKDFEKLEIVVPNEEVLKRFSKQLISVLELKNTFLTQNQNLKEARDILLPRLMTGVIEP